MIPNKLCQNLLNELHRDHAVITKMKGVAQSYFWWTELDKLIEEIAKGCEECHVAKNPPQTR